MKKHITLRSLRNQFISPKNQPYMKKLDIKIHNDHLRNKIDALRTQRDDQRKHQAYFGKMEQLLHTKSSQKAFSDLKLMQKVIHQVMILSGTKNIEQLSKQLSNQINQNLNNSSKSNSNNNSGMSKQESEAESKYHF